MFTKVERLRGQRADASKKCDPHVTDGGYIKARGDGSESVEVFQSAKPMRLNIGQFT